MTSITIDALDAEIIREFKYTGEPIYRTMTRIIREYAPPEVVERCKVRLEASRKKALARIEAYGPEHQSTLTNEEIQDKPLGKQFSGIPKADYIELLKQQYHSTTKQAMEEAKRRIKEGLVLERHGYIEVIQ